MRTAAAAIAVLVERLVPFDELESGHRADALRWIGSTTDVFRRIPPRTPSKHLVAYFLLCDERDGSVLLVHHRKAEQLDRRGAELLFRVLTEREEKNSVAIASNESFSWGGTKTSTDPGLCAAIVAHSSSRGPSTGWAR